MTVRTLNARHTADMRAAQREASLRTSQLVALGKAKGNPAWLVPLLKLLAPPLVKAALLYFGLKFGYRVADKTIEEVSTAVSKAIVGKVEARRGKRIT